MKLIRFITENSKFSRRAVEKYIDNGDVTVNDRVVYSLTMEINENEDEIKVGNRIIKKKTAKYFKFYKPVGYECSKKRSSAKTIYDFLGKKYLQYNYVGRLDKDSEGLLLLTNDGEMLYRLTHPSFEISRTYYVKTKRELREAELKRLRKGLKDGEDFLRCDRVRKLSKFEYEIVLHTGRNREIRRMIKAVKNSVLILKRLRYGGIVLGKLKSGEIVPLKDREISILRSEVGLNG